MSASRATCANFGECTFNDIVVINTHGKATGKMFYNLPCGIVFGTKPGQTFKTILAENYEFYNPAFLGVIQNTTLTRGETKKGEEILKGMCSVREIPGKPDSKRSISSSCTFTGYPPECDNIPNMRLFLGGGEKLGHEGVWRYRKNDKGYIKEEEDVSEKFGLIPSPSGIVHQFTSKAKASTTNYEIKTKVLHEIAAGREELKLMSKTSGYELDDTYISKKKILDIMSEAIKNYIFSFETGEVAPAKYVLNKRYRGGNEEEGILLDKMLYIAAENRAITPNTVVIVLACFGGIDSETAEIIKGFIENNKSLLSMGGGGGKYNKKYKIIKSRKNKYVKSRKYVRYIRRKKTNNSKKRIYKK